MQKQRFTRPWIPQQTRAVKMENRERSADEYHTARWTRESKAFRIAHPLCRRCESKGIIRATEVTDHIRPPKVYGDFWDKKNWQPLCKNCHDRKTRLEDQRPEYRY